MDQSLIRVALFDFGQNLCGANPVDGGGIHSIAPTEYGPGILTPSRLGSGRWPIARGLPWLSILASRNDSMGIPLGNRVVASARVVSPVSGDRSNVLIGRDLVQQLRQHRCITDVAGGNLDRPNL